MLLALNGCLPASGVCFKSTAVRGALIVATFFEPST
jgi:hypothetical protein